MTDSNEYLRVEQVAALLQVDRRRVYAELRSGRLEHVRIGKRIIRISRRALEDWERAQLGMGDKE